MMNRKLLSGPRVFHNPLLRIIGCVVVCTSLLSLSAHAIDIVHYKNKPIVVFLQQGE